MSELVVKTSSILDGYIRNAAWEHCVCLIRIVIDQQTAATVQGCTSLLVTDESNARLFHGIVSAVTAPISVFGDIEVTITAYSSTIKLDYKLSTFVYQNQKLEQVLRLIMKDYQGDCIVDSEKEKKIAPAGYLQYKETDWKFLMRLLKLSGITVWANYKYLKPKIYITDETEFKNTSPLPVELYFYNGIVHLSDRAKRVENGTIIKSGIRETLYEGSRAIYSDGSTMPPGWEEVGYCEHGDKSFFAKTLKRNHNILIIFCGTKNLIDAEFDMYLSYDHIYNMVSYVNTMVNKYSGYNIYITGHSLGGHLALEASLHLAFRGLDGKLQRSESFNGFGARSNYALKYIDKIKGKVFSNEYRMDVVSEHGDQFGTRIRYDDGEHDKQLNELIKNPYVSGVDILGYNAAAALKNHSIDRFRYSFACKPQPYKQENSGFGWVTSITLVGTIIEVSIGSVKLSFKEDREKTKKEDAFAFAWLKSQTGFNMSPKVGDTVNVNFNLMPALGLLFQNAVCGATIREYKK